jgi:hypothetical protein
MLTSIDHPEMGGASVLASNHVIDFVFDLKEQFNE